VGLYNNSCCGFVRLKHEFLKCLYGSLKDECNATASTIYTDYNLVSEHRFLRGCEISEQIDCMNFSYWNCWSLAMPSVFIWCKFMCFSASCNLLQSTSRCTDTVWTSASTSSLTIPYLRVHQVLQIQYTSPNPIIWFFRDDQTWASVYGNYSSVV